MSPPGPYFLIHLLVQEIQGEAWQSYHEGYCVTRSVIHTSMPCVYYAMCVCARQFLFWLRVPTSTVPEQLQED